jgi:hypothetical protein
MYRYKIDKQQPMCRNTHKWGTAVQNEVAQAVMRLSGGRTNQERSNHARTHVGIQPCKETVHALMQCKKEWQSVQQQTAHHVHKATSQHHNRSDAMTACSSTASRRRKQLLAVFSQPCFTAGAYADETCNAHHSSLQTAQLCSGR